MKLLHADGAAALAFGVQLTHAEPTTTIVVPNPSGCTITGITALTPNGDGTFTANNGTASANCGQGTGNPGSNPPVITVSSSSLTYTLNSGAAAPTFTWSATNAASCTTGQTAATIFSNLSLSGAFATSASQLGANLCNSNGSCGGSVTVAPTTTAQAGSSSLYITCTAPDNSQKTQGITVTLNPAVVGQPTCGQSDPASDLPGYTRQCSGTISYSYSAPTYTGNFTDLTSMIGSWPGNPIYLGQGAIFYVGKTNYVSFAFTPNTANAIKFSTNMSFGSGGTISVSTRPGQFTPANTVCVQAANGSNNLIFGTNGYAGATGACGNLVKGQTYYLNFVNASAFGSPLCRTSSCTMSYTPLIVN